MLAIVLDRRRARFFDVSNGSAVELPELRSPATPGRRFHSDRADAPGRGERKYHNRLVEEEHRHYERVAKHLEALLGAHGRDGIVVAGQGPAAVTFQRSLPPDLARLVVGTTHLNPVHVTPAVVHAAARAAAAQHAHDDQAAVIAAIDEGVGTGRATNGARETLRALAKGQVRTLVVRQDMRASGFRCGDSQRLVLSAADCLAEGPAQPVQDIFAAAIEAARTQDANVVTLRDPALAKRVDGLAALLRYSEDA